jgi:hypothetical protein
MSLQNLFGDGTFALGPRCLAKIKEWEENLSS